jgi:hypothetical protein
MSYATVMVYVDADRTSEQYIRISESLANKFNATLIGLAAIAIQPPIMGEKIIIDEVAEVNAKLERIEKWFRDVAGVHHRKLEWRSVVDFPTKALAREARSADLVIMQRAKGPNDIYSSLNPVGQSSGSVGQHWSYPMESVHCARSVSS